MQSQRLGWVPFREANLFRKWECFLLYSLQFDPSTRVRLREGMRALERRKDRGRGGPRLCRAIELPSTPSLLLLLKRISSCLSLDDPGNLVFQSCQLTSEVANGSQLLSSDAETYNLSSFVVCGTENTAKPAGRVCCMSRDLVGMVQFIHTYQGRAINPYHCHFSSVSKGVRKNYDRYGMEGT